MSDDYASRACVFIAASLLKSMEEESSAINSLEAFVLELPADLTKRIVPVF
jgi:hypothetical protein